ncbi:MAG: YceI family protein [Robiginitomaculum sp.]|nr:YceI family protein [Robiginitomaculum sp.]
MRVFTFLLVVLGFSLSACGAPDRPSKVNAQSPATETTQAKTWQLRGSESQLGFISVKKGTIVETNSFTDFNGTVLPDGGATIVVKLDSVETNIGIRNKRMKEHLFEIDKFPSVVIKAQLDLTQFSSLSVGERKDIEIPINISLHGHNDVMDIAMVVTRLGDNKIVVDSRTPVIIDADTFGFGAGIAKLQELAKLNVIAPEIPVMFSLVFAQE